MGVALATSPSITGAGMALPACLASTLSAPPIELTTLNTRASPSYM